MKYILGVIIVFGLGIVGVLTYIGLMPGLSPLVVRAKDLGIQADSALVAAFDEKHAMKNQLPDGIVPEDREPIYEGSVHLDESLSSELVTSVLAYWRKQYKKMPIRDVQVKFYPDGTGEVSGVLEVSAAVGMAKQLGYDDGQIEKGKQYAGFVAGDIPFYLKGTGSVTRDVVEMNASVAQVGNIQLPDGIATPLIGVVEDAIERRMKQVPGLHIESARIENGAIHITGDMPNIVK